MRVFVGEGSDFVAWLIKAVTKSPFTHAGIHYDTEAPDKVLHSTVGGVQWTTMSYINSHYKTVINYNCKFDEAREGADLVAAAFSGAKYDYLSFVGLGIAILLGLKKNPIGQHSQLMCSELPAHWLNRCQSLNPSLNIPYFDPEMTTPGDLAQFFESRTDLFEKI